MVAKLGAHRPEDFLAPLDHVVGLGHFKTEMDAVEMLAVAEGAVAHAAQDAVRLAAAASSAEEYLLNRADDEGFLGAGLGSPGQTVLPGCCVHLVTPPPQTTARRPGFASLAMSA